MGNSVAVLLWVLGDCMGSSAAVIMWVHGDIQHCSIQVSCNNNEAVHAYVWGAPDLAALHAAAAQRNLYAQLAANRHRVSPGAQLLHMLSSHPLCNEWAHALQQVASALEGSSDNY